MFVMAYDACSCPVVYILLCYRIAALHKRGAQQILGTHLDALLNRHCALLYLSNDITHTCCLGVAEDCIPAHHAALADLAMVLAVVRLEASGLALEIFYGA